MLDGAAAWLPHAISALLVDFDMTKVARIQLAPVNSCANPQAASPVNLDTARLCACRCAPDVLIVLDSAIRITKTGFFVRARRGSGEFSDSAGPAGSQG